MAFDPRLLSPLLYSNGSTVWLYRTASDALASISGGYFNTAASRLRPADWIMVAAPDGASALAVIPTAGGGIGVTAALSGAAPVPVPTLVVNTPAPQSGAAPFTVVVSGSYAGGNSGAVEVSTSTSGGASWSGWSTLVASPGGGTYSGTVVFATGGPACRVRTRMTGAPGVIATSGDFALVVAAQPGDGEGTGASGTGDTGAGVTPGGTPGAELELNTPFVALRADQAAEITTAGGAVSKWSGVLGTNVSAVQNAAGNQPAHNQAGGFLTFSSTGLSDPDGDWLDIPALGTRYQSGQSDTGATRLGVIYQLFRLPSVPNYNAVLHRVGANNTAFQYASYRAHILGIYGGILSVLRGDGAGSIRAEAGACPANQWIAAAHVLNDDRTSPGTSDNVSRLLVKTKAGGPWSSMVVASTAAKQIIYHPSTRATINRALYNSTASDGSATMDLAAFYFDSQPPRDNAAIEANLDKLLARV